MTTEFPSLVVDIERRLREIASVVRRYGRRLLENYGITPPQFDALLILHNEGELTIGDLSNKLFLAYSTTTDLVDRLERAEFVLRQRDTTDRRVVRVQLCELGQKIIEDVMNARRDYLNTVLGHVEASDRQRILEVLELLHTTIADSQS